jgi:hypothetical protein
MTGKFDHLDVRSSPDFLSQKIQVFLFSGNLIKRFFILSIAGKIQMMRRVWVSFLLMTWPLWIASTPGTESFTFMSDES